GGRHDLGVGHVEVETTRDGRLLNRTVVEEHRRRFQEVVEVSTTRQDYVTIAVDDLGGDGMRDLPRPRIDVLDFLLNELEQDVVHCASPSAGTGAPCTRSVINSSRTNARVSGF